MSPPTPFRFEPPSPPTITSASYDPGTGQVTVGANEPVTVVNTSPAPWTVTFGGVSQPIVLVAQAGPNVLLVTNTGGGGSILLSYAGGANVVGDVTGLPLEPVTNFVVTT
jgi:hypothetical protein